MHEYHEKHFSPVPKHSDAKINLIHLARRDLLESHGEGRDEDVGTGQTDDEVVGRDAELVVAADGNNDEQVPEDRGKDDDGNSDDFEHGDRRVGPRRIGCGGGTGRVPGLRVREEGGERVVGRQDEGHGDRDEVTPVRASELGESGERELEKRRQETGVLALRPSRDRAVRGLTASSGERVGCECLRSAASNLLQPSL